jgi:hypothetical protein
MTPTSEEQHEILDDLLEKMDECAELVRALGSERLNAYCLAAFEGKHGGWLGEFERDIIEDFRDALDSDEDDED